MNREIVNKEILFLLETWKDISAHVNNRFKLVKCTLKSINLTGKDNHRNLKRYFNLSKGKTFVKSLNHKLLEFRQLNEA